MKRGAAVLAALAGTIILGACVLSGERAADPPSPEYVLTYAENQPEIGRASCRERVFRAV